MTVKELQEKQVLENLSALNRTTREEFLRVDIAEILPALSVSYLAKHYFDKSPAWFYQRLNGNIVNGKKASFTDAEIDTIADALVDLSERIRSTVSFWED